MPNFETLHHTITSLDKARDANSVESPTGTEEMLVKFT